MKGQFTYQTAHGHSAIDYFIASSQCMAAVQSLHVVQEAARYHSDHNPLFLRIACEALADAPVPTSSATPDARVRYDAQKAEAYQVSLASAATFHSTHTQSA